MNVDGETRVLGIIGHPIRHTKSPLIHNLIAERQGKNLVYVPFEVESDAALAVQGAYALGIGGMNVTVPYKSVVMDSLAGVEELAGRIGAVNTLVRTKTGFQGYNTDITGLERELRSEGISLAGRHILLLGAGGAARAAAFLCAKEQADSVTLLNRTLEKAEAIAQDVRAYSEEIGFAQKTKVRAMSLGCCGELVEERYIVFQCTQLGLYPHEEEAVIEDAAFYKMVETGIDLIYNPRVTKFMRLVEENGGRAYNGLKMLLYQAVSAYELWTETSVSEEIINQVYECLQ